jgi:WD40 repeat protein
VSGIAFSPDGLHLATLGSEDGNMQLWNIKRRRELWHRRGQPYAGPRGGRKRVHEPVNSVAFSPRGESIACIEGAYNEPSALVLRSVSDGTERGRIEGGTENFTEVAMSAGARSIAVGTAAGAIQVWAISKEWKQSAVLGGITSAISALAFHPHQQAIVAASDDGEVAMWRLERRRWERLWYRHTLESAERIAFSNTGSNVALIRYYSNSVSVFDSESGKTIAEEDGISSPWHLYQETGDSFVVTSSEDEMSVRSTARGEIIGILPVGLKRFTQSRDGRLFAGTKGRQLHLYRLEFP